MSISLFVRLPDRTAKALEELAKATDRPKTYFIEKALELYLAENADYQLALNRLRDKKDPIISVAELRKQIGRRPRGVRSRPRKRSAESRGVTPPAGR